MTEAVLAVMEQHEGKLNRMSWEALAAAQQLARELSGSVEAVVIGQGVRSVAEEVTASHLSCVRLVEDLLLREYTPDAYSLALQQVIAATKPYLVLLPHTYQVRDFAPPIGCRSGALFPERLHRLPPGKWRVGIYAPTVPGQD